MVCVVDFYMELNDLFVVAYGVVVSGVDFNVEVEDFCVW